MEWKWLVDVLKQPKKNSNTELTLDIVVTSLIAQWSSLPVHHKHKQMGESQNEYETRKVGSIEHSL